MLLVQRFLDEKKPAHGGLLGEHIQESYSDSFAKIWPVLVLYIQT